MKGQQEALYAIPAKYRRLENLHIVFWLVKDISWCMIWKPLGLVMIVPTLSVAIFIAWRTKEMKSELAHNLAIAFWITANSYWMISEFFGFDTMAVWNQFEGKHLALVPFLIGAGILAYYYIIVRPKEVEEHHVITM
ncbi:MAG: hypothetical protein GC171_13035 [Terrimonas sp.]|nr:hypothetical protein [Terrimonas sp.]